MNLTERATKILLQPQQEWEVISREATTTADLYQNYIVLLAAIGPVASFIGLSIVGLTVPFVGTFRVPVVTSLISAVVFYILALVGVYVLALIIDFLAPTFSGQKTLPQALKVAAYSSTASWLAGIFMIVPSLGILGILGLYSIYLLYLGLPVLMKSPKEKSLPYTIAVVIAAIIIFAVVSAVPRAFISYPAPSVSVPGLTEKAARDMEEAAKKMQEGAAAMQQQGGQMTDEEKKQMDEAAKQMQEMMKNAPQKEEAK